MSNEATPRWYCVNKIGVTILCADEADAKKVAATASQARPNDGPHKAVQLVEYTAQPAPVQEPVATDVQSDRAYLHGLQAGYSLGQMNDEKGFAAACEAYRKGLSEAAPKAPAREWVGLEAEDRLCAKYMQDAPEGIEAVIDYIETRLKEKNT